MPVVKSTGVKMRRRTGDGVGEVMAARRRRERGREG
jgi:hypothetical protein